MPGGTQSLVATVVMCVHRVSEIWMRKIRLIQQNLYIPARLLANKVSLPSRPNYAIFPTPEHCAYVRFMYNGSKVMLYVDLLAFARQKCVAFVLVVYYALYYARRYNYVCDMKASYSS